MESKRKQFEKLLHKYRDIIDERLKTELSGALFEGVNENAFMERYSGAFSAFCEGGKRLRSFLVILGYNMCGHETDDDIVMASLSYELFQSGVLIHDDIIDESDLRRNRPAMHIELGNGQEGISKAICVGDLGLLTAGEAVMRTGFNDAVKVRAALNLVESLKLTVAGEIRDIELSCEEDCSIDDIVKMYELKTAQYTFIGPLQLGMLLGGASKELLSDAFTAGRLIGIAFQIKDDILGIYGAADTTGKSSVSDIEEGKKTVLTAYFKDNASFEKKEEFSMLYGRGRCDEKKAANIRKLLDESGASSYAEAKCREYTTKARNVVEKMQIPDQCRDALLGMLEYMNDRDS